jgi:hypothetical protein
MIGKSWTSGLPVPAPAASIGSASGAGAASGTAGGTSQVLQLAGLNLQLAGQDLTL